MAEEKYVDGDNPTPIENTLPKELTPEMIERLKRPYTCELNGKEKETGFRIRGGPEPTRHGDWSHNGRVTDF
jgi:hypothetical protein